MGSGTSGELIRIADYGNFNLTGYKVYWRWVFGHGFCTNLVPYDDENTYQTVCPFLKDEKFGRRECALVGTIYEDWYTKACNDMAPLVFTQEERDAWKTAHPLCGYDWE